MPEETISPLVDFKSIPKLSLNPLKQQTNYFRVTLVEESEYTSQKWKNGLGTTDEIWIDPPGSDFHKSFKWRLSRAWISSSCSFSHYPNCTNTIVILPNPIPLGTSSRSNNNLQQSGSSQGSLDGLQQQQQPADHSPVVKITHNETTPNLVRCLVPYTYSGAWQTSCHIHKSCRDITVMVNQNEAKSEVSVETVDEEQAFRHLMLVSACACYVVDGSIRVNVDGQTVTVKQGQTIVIEKSDGSSPRWVVITPDTHNSRKSSATKDHHHSGTDNVTSAAAAVGNISIEGDTKPLFPPGTVASPVPNSTSINRTKTLQSTFIFVQIKAIPKSVEEEEEKGQKLSRKGSIVLNEVDNRDSETRYPLSEPAFVYSPPPWSLQPTQESNLPPPKNVDRIDWESVPKGTVSAVWVQMFKQGLSDWIKVPCIIARGALDSPINDCNGESEGTALAELARQSNKEIVFGMTAALHGNEVNGVNCLQRLMADLDVSKLRGTVIAVLCINTPGYLNFKREFSDGKDLNRQFPGKKDGVASQIYAHCVMEKIISNFDYLIDLHTASFGRVNSYYVRADMNDPLSAAMARLQQPQIILHNSGQDGTMRSAASQRGIRSITVEIGNPQQFQSQFIQWTCRGLRNILHELGMYHQSIPSTPSILRSVEEADTTQQYSAFQDIQPYPAVLCSKGFWMYTKTGGVLEVYPTVNMFVKKGMLIARILNIYGNTVDEYEAPCDSMVIGKSSNPVAMAGDRIIHLGVLVHVGDVLPAVAKENY